MLLVAFALICVAIGQQICTQTGVGVQGGVVTIDKMPPQKVVYVNIIGPAYFESMRTGYRMLDYVLQNKYPKSTVDYLECTTSSCTTNWNAYTQIWVADLSSNSDNAGPQLTGYSQIATWYTGKEQPHIIADGRLLSSLWPVPTSSTDPSVYDFTYPAGGPVGRPNPRLIEDYFVTLALRGGGLMLGTDHQPFVDGINTIFSNCGFNIFYGEYYSEPLVVQLDTESVCVSYPMDASEAVWNDARYTSLASTGQKYLWDDSSTAYAPINQQPNSLILYPIAWHGDDAAAVNRPAISTTIRGSSGFLINITSPSCGYLAEFGPNVSFVAVVNGGGVPPITWQWSSNVDGVFGATQDTQNTLSPGVHVVTVQATDAQHFVAKAWVSITLYVSSGQGECFIFARDSQEVVEYYPINAPDNMTAVAYYSYGTPLPNRANTVGQLEDQVPLSSNVALYAQGNSISLIWVQSDNPLPAQVAIALTMTQDRKVDNRLDNVTVTLRDDPTDVGFVWNPKTLSGKANWTFQQTTKGFILGGLPDADSDRWCINFQFLQTSGINFVDVYGRPAPTIQDVQLAQFGLSTNITFCRTICGCPVNKQRHDYWGFIEPIQWDAGNPGNFFNHYNDQYSCTWTIAPTGESTPVEGIVFHFDGSFGIAQGDSLSMFGYSTGSSVAFISNTTAEPQPQFVPGPRMDVTFDTNGDGITSNGWLLHYMAMPSIFAINPSLGASTDTATAIITTAYVANSSVLGARLRKPDGTFLVLAVTYISSTKISVVIPPGPISVNIVEITNDDHVGHDFWTNKTTVTWEWFDAECADIKTCAGCAAQYSYGKCSWCNDLTNASGSFCYAQDTNLCPNDTNHKIDLGCCTQCQPLSVVGLPAGICHGGGTCQCNDTCACDPAHWATDCHCNQCPAGVNKPAGAPASYNCSGRGTCSCNGTCICDRGYQSRSLGACECTICQGVPTICSGHGTCNCDGTCTCNPGWTNPPGGPSICSCSTECPNNCSGHGVCECGVCNCDPNYSQQPDCSCANSCEPSCNATQVCGCDGKCTCPPGFSGSNCDQQADCSIYKDCPTCTKNTDCGWCGDVQVCENLFNLVSCAPNNNLLNPRGFSISLTCPTAAIASKEVDSDNKASVLVGAIVGSLAGMAAFMAIAAYFWRTAPFESVAAQGFETITGEGFTSSPIYEANGISVSNALYVE